MFFTSSKNDQTLAKVGDAVTKPIKKQQTEDQRRFLDARKIFRLQKKQVVAGLQPLTFVFIGRYIPSAPQALTSF